MRGFLLLAVIACAQHAAAMYERSDVLVLDEGSLGKLMKSDGVAAVEFYAPWCGHCKALAPHWEKAATNLKGIATLGAVDCDNQANQAICGRFGIQGFPTIKLFGPDQQKNPYTGEISKEAEDYKGPRTAKAIVDGVMKLLSDVHVEKPRNADQLKEFTKSKPETHKVVLLSEKKEVSGLYKSLSTQLHRHLAFAQVHSESVPEAAELLGMTEDVALPAVVVFKAGGGVEPYTGPVKAATLLTWLRQYAPAEAEPEAEIPGTKGGKTKEQAQAKLVSMSVDQLQELDQNEDMQLVALHVAVSPEACESKAASFRSAAAELQGILGLVAVNLTPDELTKVSRYGLDTAGVKTEVKAEGCALRVVLLPYGSDKEDLEDWQVYPAGPVEGKALYKWAISHVPGSMFTMEVTPAIMPEFVHMTGRATRRSRTDDDDDDEEEEMPQGVPLPPKVLLFTNKDEVPDLYKALAMSFRNRMPGLTFGWVRAHTDEGKEIVKSTRAPKVPGVVLLVHVPKDVPTGDDPKRPSQSATAMSSQPYTGPNTFKAMSMWLEQMIKLLEQMYGIDSIVPGPAVEQLTSAQDLDTHCVSKGSGICIIGLLGTSDPKSAKPWTQLLSKVAAKHQDQPIYFSWMDVTKFSQFASDCGALASDAPTLVALAAKRMRVAAYPGRLTQGAEGISAVSSFIDSVLMGRTRTQVLEALPRMEAGGSGSAGEGSASEGAPAEPVEEEFDLSDIMSEEVEGSDASLSKEERLKQADLEIQAAEEAARQQAAQEKSQKKKKKKSKKKKAQKEEL